MLIKVSADNQTRAQVLEAVKLFRAKVVDVATDALVIEVTGDSGKLDAFLAVLEPFGIKEIAQSGPLAIGRGCDPSPSASCARFPAMSLSELDKKRDTCG